MYYDDDDSSIPRADDVLSIPMVRQRLLRKAHRHEAEAKALRQRALRLEEQGVVRVELGGPTGRGKLYAYRLPAAAAQRAQIGDWVRVVLPGNTPHYTRIKAFGRGGYDGALLTATWVEEG